MLKKNLNANNLLAAFGLFILIILLWLPFSFKAGDIREHWHIRAMIDIGVVEYDNLREDYLDELAITRPLARVLYWTAYFISPDSFLGDNLLLVLIFWLKSLALLGLILKFFPQRYMLAFMIAALTLVYPADISSSSLRIPHIHFAIFTYLMAANFMLSYWERRQKSHLALMVVSLVLTSLSYEALYPVTFVTPFILLIKERKITWDLFRFACFWYIPSLIGLSYSFFLIFGLQYGFQGTSALDSVDWKSIILKTLNLYQQMFISAWDWRSEVLSTRMIPYAVAIAGLIFSASAYLGYRNRQEETALKPWDFGSFLLATLGLVFLGYLMYIPTNRSSEDLAYRVFLNSSVAAAAFIAGLSYQLALLIPRRIGLIVWLLALSSLIGASSYLHLNRHQNQSNIHLRQGLWLENILEIVPNLQAPSYIFFIPADGVETLPSNPFNIRHHILSASLQYLYQEPVNLRFAMTCRELVEKCQIQEEGIRVIFPRIRTTDIDIFYDSENLILIEIQADNSLVLLTEHPTMPNYNPERLIATDTTLPPRFYAIFGEAIRSEAATE